MNAKLLALVCLASAITTGSGGAGSLRADEDTGAMDNALRVQLETRLAELRSDPDRYRDALAQGRRRAELCKVCHGNDGNSVREGTPSLAGQDPVYIVDQFNRYGDGRRVDFWMGSLAASFSNEEKIELAIFYAAQPMVAAGGGNPDLLERGRELYGRLCVDCHGDDGRAAAGYARLAGQRPEYIVKMLGEFRSPAGRRYDPAMYARAWMLHSDQDIEAVATYLAHLD
jgi:cytochrome c553